MGKICFLLGKIEIWTHLEFGAYHIIFGIRKSLEYLYQLFNVLPKQMISEVKALQVYKFTFNSDSMMNRQLNFSVTRNESGHAGMYLSVWWVTLFIRVSYQDQVLEMNFSSINFDKLLKIVSFPASWVIYKWRCIAHDVITMLRYTSQSRKLKNSAVT